MAQSHETDNPIVTANTPLTDLLGAPLGPDWTVEGLAEQVLGFIAAQGSEEAQEFVLDADATTDRQSRRLLRPSSRAWPPSRQPRPARLPGCTAAISPSSDQAPKDRCGFSASSKTDQEVCALRCDGQPHSPSRHKTNPTSLLLVQPMRSKNATVSNTRPASPGDANTSVAPLANNWAAIFSKCSMRKLRNMWHFTSKPSAARFATRTWKT